MRLHGKECKPSHACVNGGWKCRAKKLSRVHRECYVVWSKDSNTKVGILTWYKTRKVRLILVESWVNGTLMGNLFLAIWKIWCNLDQDIPDPKVEDHAFPATILATPCAMCQKVVPHGSSAVPALSFDTHPEASVLYPWWKIWMLQFWTLRVLPFSCAMFCDPQNVEMLGRWWAFSLEAEDVILLIGCHWDRDVQSRTDWVDLWAQTAIPSRKNFQPICKRWPRSWRISH